MTTDTGRAGARAWRRGLWHLRHGGPSGLRRFLHRRRLAGPVPPVGGTAAAHSTAAAPGRPGVTFPAWPVPRAPLHRPGLRVAVILDDFSRLALRYEWDQVEITPQDWRAQLESVPVDLLFVESAWHGNEDAWQFHLAGPSAPRPALVELVAWCRARGVPTVFWNKEDPVHYGDFLASAALFDRVLTTDADRLDVYRADLGHGRVGVLAFAAQPVLHSPVRPGGAGRQERDVAFAGMYFAHRHPERRAQLDLLLGAADRAGRRMATGLEIFSRQLGGDERYQFPAPYADRVVGSLDYPRMLSAYRAYKVFLNVNTVAGSPTMCARRIFEITASGTPVVSTPSPAIDRVFAADEVAQVSEPVEAELTLRALVHNPELRDRMVHRAQRTVWRSHTCAHRVDDVLRGVGLDRHVRTDRRPSVSALVSTLRPRQLAHVLATVGAQRDVQVQLAVLAHGFAPDEAQLRRDARDAGIEDVLLLRADLSVPLGECLNRLVAASDGDVVAKMDDDDRYGAHYLSDQLYALAYSGADVVGKQAHYLYLAGSDVTVLRSEEREHRFTDFVAGPTIVARREVARAVPFAAVTRGEDTGFLRSLAERGARVYSADRFNFLQMRGARTTGHTWPVSDLELLASSRVQCCGYRPDHADT